MIEQTRPWDAPISAMGLLFSGPLGVAAGVDRNGEKLAALDLTGFGHIELGTIALCETLKIGMRPEGLRIGINFGCLRPGMDEAIIADYSAALRQVYRSADYLCANLTSPRYGRCGNGDGVDALICRLRKVRDLCAFETGRRAPLLIKIDGGSPGDPLPRAILEARRQTLDGLVLVCASAPRVAAIKRHVGTMTLISVGGVQTAKQARERIEAGADLVQAHKAFVDGKLRSMRGNGRMFDDRQRRAKCVPQGIPDSGDAMSPFTPMTGSGASSVLDGVLESAAFQKVGSRPAMTTSTLSTITCPSCGHRATEMMPVDAFLTSYECKGCAIVLRPKAGRDCIFCSYGDVACPPVQAQRAASAEAGTCCGACGG